MSKVGGSLKFGWPSAGLDGKGVRSHSHAPTHAILKAQVWYASRLKHCMVCFPICFDHDSFMFSTIDNYNDKKAIKNVSNN